MRLRLSLALLFLSGLPACSSPRPASSDVDPPALHLASDWVSLSHPRFSAWVDGELPEGESRELEPQAIDELTEALTLSGEIAVRAAVILGRSRTPESTAVLLERLEARVQSRERTADAGDVIAAYALATAPRSKRLAPTLAELAVGKQPHPDLEVRVECAIAALANGRDDVIPWLLRVLYVGTPRGRDLVLDFDAPTTTAWVRGRAATALSSRAGVPVTYYFDAPLADREREADRLAGLLGLEPPR